MFDAVHIEVASTKQAIGKEKYLFRIYILVVASAVAQTHIDYRFNINRINMNAHVGIHSESYFGKNIFFLNDSQFNATTTFVSVCLSLALAS